MNFSFRAIAAFDFGPGGTATIFGPRTTRVVRFAIESATQAGIKALASGLVTSS
jgi:hypothetical protein